MSSLIEGYNYDIFISYRQNDNKYDGWVTEFVANLNKELEATIKDKVTVYFDANPHDGLLETHSVDRSLEEKLRCLIFIPILSRTYCDPKGYAWNNEFLTFINIGREDNIRLNVKLTSGNVASRVLPIRIHDLNPEDITLVESSIGLIRSIDFIYKSSGVNRPLRAIEDHPQDNVNKIYYRDQINKVANAIDEIIRGLKKMQTTSESGKPKNDQPAVNDLIEYHKREASEHNKSKSKRWLIIAVSLLLCIVGVFAVYNVFNNRKQWENVSELDKSIAVLPFKLLSDEPDKQYLADGMMDAITLHLSKIKDLHVMSRTSVEQYRNAVKAIPEIGRELEVEYLLEGSFQKSGENVRLIVQLIKADQDEHIWANEYDRNWKDIFNVQSEVAQTIARELGAVITPEEKQIIEIVPTSSLTAYDFYQQLLEVYYKNPFPGTTLKTLRRMEELAYKALESDSTFAMAYCGLAGIYMGKYWNSKESYFNENYLDSVIILTDKALFYDSHLDDAYFRRALYYNNTGNPENAIIEFENAIKYNPNNWEAYRRKGSWVYLSSLYYSDYVKGLQCLHKAVSLNHSGELVAILQELAYAYTYQAGFPEEGKKYYTEAFKLHGDTMIFLDNIGSLEIQYGEFDKGMEKILKAYTRHPYNLWVAEKYFNHGQYEESLKYIMKVIERFRSSENLIRNQDLIGYTYLQNGYKKEAEYWFNLQMNFSKQAIKVGRYYSSSFDPHNAYYDLAGMYAYRGEKEKALEILRKFDRCPVMSKSMVDDIKKINPLFNSIKEDPEFQKIVQSWETKYQAEHERVRKWLEDQGKM